MELLEILKELFDQKILSVLDFVINNQGKDGLYLNEIAKGAKVPTATTYRIVSKLMKLNFLQQTRIKNLKLYKFKHTDKNRFLYDVLKKDVQVMQLFVKKIKELQGLQAVILHGEERNDRANVLLIGEGTNAEKTKEICEEIREKYNFIISYLTITVEQFDTMANMGLYSGKKTVLWKKE